MPITRVITSEVTQLITRVYFNVTDGQTDGRRTIAIPRYAHSASCRNFGAARERQQFSRDILCMHSGMPKLSPKYSYLHVYFGKWPLEIRGSSCSIAPYWLMP